MRDIPAAVISNEWCESAFAHRKAIEEVTERRGIRWTLTVPVLDRVSDDLSLTAREARENDATLRADMDTERLG